MSTLSMSSRKVSLSTPAKRRTLPAGASARAGRSPPRPAPAPVGEHQRRRLPRPAPAPAGPRRRGGPAAAAGGSGSRPGSCPGDRKSTRLNSSHVKISYAVFCLKKKKKKQKTFYFLKKKKKERKENQNVQEN